jgi:ABC-type transport system involved in multi-copper enzyme maturation permease subunit
VTAPTAVATGRRDRTPAAQVHPVNQLRAIVSEWVKLSTLRSTWITLAAALAGIVLVGAIASWAIDAHWSHIDPGERAAFSPITQSLTGVYLGQLAIGVLGVLVITGEYATGMIRATLSAVPRRLPVLWAKLVVFAAMTFVVTLIGAFIAFFVGQALLHSHGTTIGASHAVRAIVGVALYLTVVGILALGLGFVVRSTAGGIAAVFGLLLVLPALAHVLPSSWQTNVLPYLPSQAGGALFTMHPDPGTLAPWAGFAVMCGWAAAAIAAGAAVLLRRDA